MSIEREIEQQTIAIRELVDAIQLMTVTNQRILDALIDIAMGDDPDQQPLRDMDGNPV